MLRFILTRVPTQLCLCAERGRRDHGTESYSVRLCTNTECSRILWNRDVNAAINILRLFLARVNGQAKPPEFADLANEKSGQSKVPPEASACTLWGVVWVA